MARIGIHTHIVSEEQADAYKNHVSISYEDDKGEKTFYGLYPPGSDFVPFSEKKRSFRYGGNDLRENLDKNRPASYSHYTDISPEAAAEFKEWLVKVRHEYKNQENHCVHWALNAWEHTTGERLDATQIFWNEGKPAFEQTPIGLEDYLRVQDKAYPRDQAAATEAEAEVSAPGLFDKLKGFAVGFLGKADPPPDKAAPAINRLTPKQEEERDQQKVAAAISREELRKDLWYIPDSIAEEVSLMHDEEISRGNRLPHMESMAIIAEDEQQIAEDVAAGRAEKRWSTRDEPYYQYHDEQGRETSRAVLCGTRGETSPEELLRRRHDPKGRGRNEYQPGTHKEPEGPAREHER